MLHTIMSTISMALGQFEQGIGIGGGGGIITESNGMVGLVSMAREFIFPAVVRISAIVGVLVAIVGCLIYVKQDNLLYFPEIGGIPRHNKDNPKGYRSPANHNWPYEENQIVCEDGVHIHSWLLLGDMSTPSTKSTNTNTKTTTSTKIKSLPTIVYFHGNAGNIGIHLPNAIQMMMNLNRMVHILLVEYRGYGDSDTVPPNENGLKLDAQAALLFCKKHPKIDTNNIFLFGRSLGGAVAFSVAHYSQQQQQQQDDNNNNNNNNNIPPPIAGIIVENTFRSISAMVDTLMPTIIIMMKPFVLRLNWNSEQIVPTLTNIPILYLAGDQDELVPHSHMKLLYELSTRASPGQVVLHIVPGGKHNDTWMVGGQPYWTAFRNFALAIIAQRSTSSTTGSTIKDEAPIQESISSSVNIPVVAAEANTIPTTSSSLFGMAKDAIGSKTPASLDDKKDL